MVNRNPVIKYTKIFINNEFVDAASGKTFPSINPATETVVAQISEGDKADVDKAVIAAKSAFQPGSPWRRLKPGDRGILLNKLADLIDRDAEEIASIQTLENGKPWKMALGEIRVSAAVLRYYAGWADKIHGETAETDDKSVVMTRREPIGAVGQITPWNGPIALLGFKWGPALAAGCTIVLKPAEQTPLCTLHVTALTREAGFPPGVINVVPGYGPTAGAAVSEHPDITKVAFTGSVEVGKKIMIASGTTNLKRVTLELGGKSPLVIFDDANVDEAVKIAHNAIFANSGQICIAASRVFVQSKIYDEFVKKSKAMALKRKLGDPFDPTTEQGPQVDDEIFERVMGYLKVGVAEGATLEVGGKRFGTLGYYIQPTIFSNVKDNMRIAREEIFGPVQSIFKFDTMEEVIKRANDTTYGLGAGVITNDINKALKFAQAVESGSVWINQYDAICPQAPFGGWKQSGIGRELGEEALNSYLETKSIHIRLS
ncbi:aldehyde dehydrogenase, cytosolic 1 [Fopius arisanus]|uniref:Aldehyde dehydrogenase, cytosolic 1 n=1 Tax=Fopius arisanus TaxID=64838 RepID=A0A9R1U024_9HYME|nr:PREDICTED: aldehyde dehydrogenase, cytosolic 1-like [Fopius arisanus]